METEEYSNDIVSFRVEKGILYGKYLVDKINLEAALKATAFRKKITQGKAYPALADISGVKEVDRDTRSYFSKEAGEDMKAVAVVMSNPVTKMMANFFMKFNQPEYPIRFFTDQNEAKEWLERFVGVEKVKYEKSS